LKDGDILKERLKFLKDLIKSLSPELREVILKTIQYYEKAREKKEDEKTIINKEIEELLKKVDPNDKDRLIFLSNYFYPLITYEDYSDIRKKIKEYIQNLKE